MSEADVTVSARVVNEQTGEEKKVVLVVESDFAADVRMELERARGSANGGKPFPPIASLHEGYSIILEEIDEFWDEVKKKARDRDVVLLYKELVQIAAMAQRTAEDVLSEQLPTPHDPFEAAQ